MNLTRIMGLISLALLSILPRLLKSQAKVPQIYIKTKDVITTSTRRPCKWRSTPGILILIMEIQRRVEDNHAEESDLAVMMYNSVTLVIHSRITF
jgi:hypothetical protein